MAPWVYLELKIFHNKTCKLTGYKTNRISRTALGNAPQEKSFLHLIQFENGFKGDHLGLL